MTGRPVSDARVDAALRAYLPDAAQAGLQARVLAAVEATPQQRPVPSLLAPLVDADPTRRQRNLLIAAAFLLGVAVASVVAVGAWQLLQRESPLDLAPPGDLPALVHSTYGRMPEMAPVAITTLTDGSSKGRIYVGRSGAIRIERFASLDAAVPDTYEILNGTTGVRVELVGSERFWIEQAGAISEDPRVFLLAEMQGAGVQPTCATSPTGTEPADPSSAPKWTYVAAEEVAGRPAYHVACGGGELWIDVETSLVLRSRGPELDRRREPIPGTSRTVEVVEIEFGPQPDQLFAIAQPPGIARMTPEEYEAYRCAQDPICSAKPATPPPAYTPPPGTTPGPPPSLIPRLTANGWIAFSRQPLGRIAGPTDIYIARAGTEPRLLVSREEPGRNKCPSFSPDGTKVAFGSAVGPTGDGGWTDLAIVVLGVDGSGPNGRELRIPVPRGYADIPCPSWSADGSRVAYRTDEGDIAIAVLNGETTVIPPPEDAGPWIDFEWSPVANEIVGIRHSGLWLVPTEGGAARRIRAAAEGEFASLSLSPDGLRAAIARYEEKDSTAAYSVRIVRLDGSAADVDLASGTGPFWSPTGDRLAYRVNHRTVVVDADGSHARDVAPVGIPARSDLVVGAPVMWSPDGRWFLSNTSSVDGYGLALIPVNGDMDPVVLVEPSFDLDAVESLGLSWQRVGP